jgi:predicted rRNA methylase YqxC with S4 and FtsJ domains
LLDTLFCKEDYVTSKAIAEKIAKFINKHNYENKKFYDLGSSRGGFVLDIIEKCPKLQITGIDNSLLRIWISKSRAYFSNKKVVFIKKDIFKTDVSKADIVYIYIPRILLPKLAIKLERELSREATVVTNRINFTDWEPTEVIPKNSKNENEQDIFIYKYPFKKRV